MHMCDCFIYAMIAFATYLLKVRADAIRLAGTKRTPHTYTAWLLIRFDFIYILNNNNSNKSAKQKKKKIITHLTKRVSLHIEVLSMRA